MYKATAIANTNIALIKYWGNRNHQLSLPYNSSISMTLDGMYTTTSVEFSKSYENEVIINGNHATSEEQQRVVNHLTEQNQVIMGSLTEIKEALKEKVGFDG